jgi:hypothetical protein
VRERVSIAIGRDGLVYLLQAGVLLLRVSLGTGLGLRGFLRSEMGGWLAVVVDDVVSGYDRTQVFGWICGERLARCRVSL